MADPCLLQASRAFRDPHLSFAHGGRADFRGRHNGIYNFLSAPGFAVNVKTEQAVFTIHEGALTVNGTFLTEAHVVAEMPHQRRAVASFWASELDSQQQGWQVVNGSCTGRRFKFGRKGHKTCFELEMAMTYSSATFELGGWTMTVHGMPSCRGCLVAGPGHRLDIGFTARGDALRDKCHGIIGPRLALPSLGRVYSCLLTHL